MYIHTHTYIHTYIHTCMHACMHTYIYIYIYIYIRYSTPLNVNDMSEDKRKMAEKIARET